MGRGIMSAPDLIMLDEPSLGLAPLLVNTIFDTIKEIKAMGKTILLVEQNALKALSVADNAYVLEQGRITKSGPGRENFSRTPPSRRPISARPRAEFTEKISEVCYNG